MLPYTQRDIRSKRKRKSVGWGYTESYKGIKVMALHDLFRELLLYGLGKNHGFVAH
jgi:hypothetical protein